MLKTLLISLGLTTALLLSRTAAAQADPPPEAPPPVVVPTHQVMDFSEVTLEGIRQKPTGTYVLGRVPPHFAPLIKLRTHFVPEILRSVDSL